MYQLIKINKILSWNNKREIEDSNNGFIPNSNIKTLILHATHNSSEKPLGMYTFYKKLSKIKLPKGMVINKRGIKIMVDLTKKRDKKWRPPGDLIKEKRYKNYSS